LPSFDLSLRIPTWFIGVVYGGNYKYLHGDEKLTALLTPTLAARSP
jgi:hypothetical protein